MDGKGTERGGGEGRKEGGGNGKGGGGLKGMGKGFLFFIYAVAVVCEPRLGSRGDWIGWVELVGLGAGRLVAEVNWNCERE